jgi:ribonuclease HI
VQIYSLKFDGACGPKNPGGIASYGFILNTPAGEAIKGHGVIGEGPTMSNNVAEFAALAAGLHAFIGDMYKTGIRPVTLLVKGDSNVVINIMSRRWRAHSDKLYWTYYLECLGLVTALRKDLKTHVSFDWIPREANQDCDDLSKKNR